MLGSLEISGEFRDWCRQQMMSFNGNDDLTLIEFLMQLNSGGRCRCCWLVGWLCDL
jgi:hypothetical protein